MTFRDRPSDAFAAIDAAVRAAAPTAVARMLEAAEAAVRSAPTDGASARVWDRLRTGIRVSRPASVGARDRASGTLRVGGTAPAFSGGGSIRDVIMGAEFGARGGDNVVRVRTSGGRSQTVDASRFSAYAQAAQAQSVVTITRKNGKRVRRAAKRGTAGAEAVRITGVRRGGLPQFPPPRASGYVVTPALDDGEDKAYEAAQDELHKAIAGEW